MGKRQKYSKEYKILAVELVKAGKPIAEVAEELPIGTGVLYRWVTESNKLQDTLGKVVTS